MKTIEISDTLPICIHQDQNIYAWFSVNNLSKKSPAIIMISCPDDFKITIARGEKIGDNKSFITKKNKATSMTGEFTISTPRYDDETARDIELEFKVEHEGMETIIIKKKRLLKEIHVCD